MTGSAVTGPWPHEEPVTPVAALWWLLVGAAVAVGLVGLLSVGLVPLGLGLVMALVGARSRRLGGRSVRLVIAGAAAAPLLLAWLNRDGPGRVCRVAATETTCADRYSPWPFVVVAVVLVVVGTVLARRGSEPA